MNRRGFFARLVGVAAVAPAVSGDAEMDWLRAQRDKPPKPEPMFARVAAPPVCPKCGDWVIFVGSTWQYGKHDLVPVTCHDACGWKGVALKSYAMPWQDHWNPSR